MKTFDFRTNSVQELNFETLKKTYKENDIYGKPLRGIYHFDAINKVVEMCESANLNFEINSIFAAQNHSKQYPGVSILPQVEETHGENAVEAHILRRVYSTIKIHDGADEELSTSIAIAYHQEGLQIGFGPLVNICTNQTILSAERFVSNYGKDKVSDEQLFEQVREWTHNFFDYRAKDLETIQKMKKIPVSYNDVLQLIGLLTSIRVMKDSRDKVLSSKVEDYALNQAQISMFTEMYLQRHFKGEINNLWDVYNVATEIYKPYKMDVPRLFKQNFEFIEVARGLYDF